MKNKLTKLLALVLAALLLFTGCELAEQILPEVLEVLSTLEYTEPTQPTDTEEAQQWTEPPQDEQTEPAEELYTEQELTLWDVWLPEDGTYTSRDDVAVYIHLYGHLPSNFITKDEAKALGWDSRVGNLDRVAPGKSIGGDRFGNYEGLLPEGHRYYECDIDYEGGFRNSQRIIFSEDGLIYYTEDHYETFTLLYGGD